jgi:hypothetical protein
MTQSGTHHAGKKDKASVKQSDLPSSPGDSPIGVTPMDVSPDDAAARDTKERAICSEDIEEHMEASLDEAVDLTFPASDPIAPASITKIEKPDHSHDKSDRK